MKTSFGIFYEIPKIVVIYFLSILFILLLIVIMYTYNLQFYDVLNNRYYLNYCLLASRLLYFVCYFSILYYIILVGYFYKKNRKNNIYSKYIFAFLFFIVPSILTLYSTNTLFEVSGNLNCGYAKLIFIYPGYIVLVTSSAAYGIYLIVTLAQKKDGPKNES